MWKRTTQSKNCSVIGEHHPKWSLRHIFAQQWQGTGSRWHCPLKSRATASKCCQDRMASTYRPSLPQGVQRRAAYYPQHYSTWWWIMSSKMDGHDSGGQEGGSWRVWRDRRVVPWSLICRWWNGGLMRPGLAETLNERYGRPLLKVWPCC